VTQFDGLFQVWDVGFLRFCSQEEVKRQSFLENCTWLALYSFFQFFNHLALMVSVVSCI
jgi:hypothetical protein